MSLTCGVWLDREGRGLESGANKKRNVAGPSGPVVISGDGKKAGRGGLTIGGANDALSAGVACCKA